MIQRTKRKAPDWCRGFFVSGWRRSEVNFARDLNGAARRRVAVSFGARDHVCHLPEILAGEIAARRCKVGMVEGVETFQAQLNVARSIGRNREVFGDAQIRVIET